jgi:hypothetical protein
VLNLADKAFNEVEKLKVVVTWLNDIVGGLKAKFDCFTDECYDEAIEWGSLVGNGADCNIIDWLECFPKCFFDAFCMYWSKHSMQREVIRDTEPTTRKRDHLFTKKGFGGTIPPEYVGLDMNKTADFDYIVYYKWRNFLTQNNITNATMCGGVMWDYTPVHLSNITWGDHSAFVNCFSIVSSGFGYLDLPQFDGKVNDTETVISNVATIPSLVTSMLAIPAKQEPNDTTVLLPPVPQPIFIINSSKKKNVRNSVEYERAISTTGGVDWKIANRQMVASLQESLNEYVSRNVFTQENKETMDGTRLEEGVKKGINLIDVDKIHLFLNRTVKFFRDAGLWVANISDSFSTLKRNEGSDKEVAIHKKWQLGQTFLSYKKKIHDNNRFFQLTSQFISNHTLIMNKYERIKSQCPAGVPPTDDNCSKRKRNQGYQQQQQQSEYAVMDDTHYEFTLTTVETEEDEKLLEIQKDFMLIELYVNYVNDVRYLYYQNRGFKSSVDKYKSSSSMMDSLNSMKKMEFKRLTKEDLVGKKRDVDEFNENVTRYSNQTMETLNGAKQIFEIVAERYQLKYTYVFRALHFVYSILTSTGNVTIKDARSVLHGKKSYFIDEGLVNSTFFVNMTEDHPAKRNFDYRAPIFVFSLNSLFNVTPPYRIPKKYGFFMTEKNGSYFPDLKEELFRRLDMVDQIIANKTANSNATILGDEETDFNREFIRLIDDIVTYFRVTVKGDIVKYFDKLIDYWKNFNIKKYFEEKVENTLETIVECDYPAQINGSSIYSPFCLPLIDEKVFSWIEPPDQIYVQIPWPSELIEQDCVNTYNGEPYLFKLRFSDNCNNTDGYTRPGCPKTDYCPRTYKTCKSFGFKSFVHAFAFLLGSVPGIINSFTQPSSGIAIEVFREFALIIVTGVSLPIPFLLLITIPLTIVGVWFIWISFGAYVPYGLILLPILVLIFIFVPSLIVNFPAVYILGVVFTALWIISLLVTIPELRISPTLELANALVSAQDYVEGTIWIPDWIIPDFGVFVEILKRFDYTSTDFVVPTADIFCFCWTFGNLVYLYLIYRYSPAALTVVFGILKGFGSLLMRSIVASFTLLYGAFLLMAGLETSVRKVDDSLWLNTDGNDNSDGHTDLREKLFSTRHEENKRQIKITKSSDEDAGKEIKKILKRAGRNIKKKLEEKRD